MRKMFVLFTIFIATSLFAQDKSSITVKGTETTNGVVIVTAQRAPLGAGQQIVESARKTIELQCNKDISGCTPLKPGNYLLVKLPPNRGMYDCADVQVYASTADPTTADRIGEYCLTEK